MSKKMEHNGLWESSRMMLPQHREAFLLKQKTIAQQSKPQLHEDEYELIVRHIKESFYTQKLIIVEHWHEQSCDYITGSVSQIDEQHQRIRVENIDTKTWLSLSEITSVHNADIKLIPSDRTH
jgi:hypothetical protein